MDSGAREGRRKYQGHLVPSVRLQLTGSHHPASPPLQTVTWLHILPYVAMVLDTSDSYVVDEVISSEDWSTSAVFFLVS